MSGLKTDIQLLVEDWKCEKLYFHHGRIASYTSGKVKLPVVTLYITDSFEFLQGSEECVRYNFQLGVWDRYPKGCSSLEEVLEKNCERLQKMRSILKTLVYVLQKHFGYSRLDNFAGAFRYKDIPFDATEHKLFGTVLTGVLENTGEVVSCCDISQCLGIESIKEAKGIKPVAAWRR